MHDEQQDRSEVAKREDEERQRLELAIMLFQVASYSLIKQCMLDAGFSGKNIEEYDPLYINFVKWAISSELKRIEHLIQVTTKKSIILSLAEHDQRILGLDVDIDRKHYVMLQKAVTIFQVKVCSVMKQSMLQAQYPRYQTYECHHNYITFARMALDKELDRVSRFSKQNKDINKTSDHDLLYTDQDHCSVGFSVAKKSITSDSTELTGSLTGRKRFFERVTAECKTIISNKKNQKPHMSTSSGSSSSNTNHINNTNYNNNVYQNINNPKSNTPVILNPYYHQLTANNTNTNAMVNQNQPTTIVGRKKKLMDTSKKHKKN